MTECHQAGPTRDAFAFHGGRLDAAAAMFPDARLPWIDLSTGISPFAWPAERLEPPDLRALPCPDTLAKLCAAAAGHFGVAPSTVAAVPGSEIGLRLIAGLDPPRPWRHVVPAYRTHGESLPGARPIDAAAVEGEAVRGGTLLLANPNNPDGGLWAPDRLLAVARTLRKRGGLLIVDEAFADTVPTASLLPHLQADDPVLVFRSFGKFFGLAGVRLGFAAGEPRWVKAVADRLGSWPVSATAIACGTAAYRDRDWIVDAVARLVATAARLDRLLARRGLTATGGCPLFRLVSTPDASALFDRLARHGILVRPFNDAPGWLRFGLPADAGAMARLDEALGNR